MTRCNIAIVMVVHDERRLERAIQSIVRGSARPFQVYLVDNGSTEDKAIEQIAGAEAALVAHGVSVSVRRNASNEKVGVVRAQVFQEIRATPGIDVVTCLDGDDELGVASLEAFQAAYKQHRGQLDVIVPSAIAYRFDSDEDKVGAFELRVPALGTARPNATDDEVWAWVNLTKVGATFGIRVNALAVNNGFSHRHQDDEWVWMFTGWARRRARFVLAEIPAVNSYQYWQHDLRPDPNAKRRAQHTAMRRFRTARRALTSSR